jgi:hypothetical protein
MWETAKTVAGFVFARTTTAEPDELHSVRLGIWRKRLLMISQKLNLIHQNKERNFSEVFM